MATPLEQVAKDFPTLKKNLDEAEDLVKALREAGEDVSAQVPELEKQRTRLKRWEGMLRRRGLLT